MDLIALLWKIFLAVLSSIPLYFAIHLVKSGPKPGIFKVTLVNVLAGIVVSAVHSAFGLSAGIISFIAVLFVYREMFDLGWILAFIVWLLEAVILAIIWIILIALGVALVL